MGLNPDIMDPLIIDLVVIDPVPVIINPDPDVIDPDSDIL